jgi:hypothetical protein
MSKKSPVNQTNFNNPCVRTDHVLTYKDSSSSIDPIPVFSTFSTAHHLHSVNSTHSHSFNNTRYATSHTVRLMSTPQARISAKLRDARNLLMEDGFYLGNSSVRDSVTWHREGRAHYLVTKSSAVAFEDAVKASAADPSAPAPSPPELATLSAIVYIADENFWFTSCARWRGPTPVSPSFADIKPSFLGQAPADDPVRADFAEVISNIKGLMAMASTPGFTTKRGVLVGAANDTMLKIKHQVFEVRFIFSLVLGYISHVSYLQKVDPSQPVDGGSETASESDRKYSAICRHILFNSYYSATAS